MRQAGRPGDGSQDQAGVQTARKLHGDEAAPRSSQKSNPQVRSRDGNWGQTQELPGRSMVTWQTQTRMTAHRSQSRATETSDRHISHGAQAGPDGPRLSLNGTPGPMDRGVRGGPR